MPASFSSNIDRFILKKLIAMRCKRAEQRQKKLVVSQLGSKKVSVDGDDRLRNIFPPRRKWIHPNLGERKNKTQLCINERSLQKTIQKEARQEIHSDWYLALQDQVNKLKTLALRGDFKFSKPNVFAVEKKRTSACVEVRPICQFKTLEECVIGSYYNSILTHLFDKYFYDKSFAFRVTRGGTTMPHLKAIQEIIDFRKKHPGVLWVAECDMKKFYDTIDHAVIKTSFEALLHRCLIDGKIDKVQYNLLKNVMFSYVDCYNFYQDVFIYNKKPSDEFWSRIKGGDIKKEVKWIDEDLKKAKKEGWPYSSDDYYKNNLGVPQGGALSGLIANIVMNEVDQKLKSFWYPEDPDLLYIRFCDDMIMMGTDQSKVSKAFDIYCKEVKKMHLFIHEDINWDFDEPKAFWDGKTRSTYKWAKLEGKDMKVMPWITFVGYDINWKGDTRIRKSTLAKEIKKQYEKVAEVENLLKHASPRRYQKFILDSVTKRMIGMSVGRVDMWNYKNFDNNYSWASAYVKLSDNRWSRKQLQLLDRHRCQMLSRLHKFLTRLDYHQARSIPTDSKKSKREYWIRYKGGPYSYYGQVLVWRNHMAE